MSWLRLKITHKGWLALCLACAVPLIASAAEPDAQTKTEIAHLISQLGSSGCQFNRNGSWYSAERAVRHLNRKYEYLLARGLVPSAEAFIERAASESSASGKPYLVKCEGEPVTSAAWLTEKLKQFRSRDDSTKRP